MCCVFTLTRKFLGRDNQLVLVTVGGTGIENETVTFRYAFGLNWARLPMDTEPTKTEINTGITSGYYFP
jgi:hypothetical protein